MALTRGEIWTVSGGIYATKPRPAVILQADQFIDVDSVTVVPFTGDGTQAPLFRLAVVPDSGNGLAKPSSIMVDKITTVPRSNLGSFIGRLGGADMVRLNRAVVVFLGVV